ncbi:MAG: peptidoglycan-associated lipoprotein Pal [Deltaproteobacteria bacterium]|nr:peptidoglycan-associated lipoprotein Pal [Deltaproteobacteria bacterium]
MRCARGWYWRLGCVLLVTVFISGCPKKTPPPSEVGGPGGGLGPGERGETNLPPPGDTTREHIEHGPGEEGGPLQDIHFAYDSFELSSEARETLRTNSDWLRNNSQAKIEIEGHCDDRGTAEYNLALGAKRAKAARDYLASLGISPERLSTISYGEELPSCREETESCWEQNRRAHFQLLTR